MVPDAPLDQTPARVDRWLWCVRLFKTRSAATEACRAEHVSIGGQIVKASREIRPGECVVVQQGLVRRELRFLGAPTQRIGAKQVPLYAEDLTPPEAWAKAREAPVQQLLARARGAGRPTKRERRQIEAFLEGD